MHTTYKGIIIICILLYVTCSIRNPSKLESPVPSAREYNATCSNIYPKLITVPCIGNTAQTCQSTELILVL